MTFDEFIEAEDTPERLDEILKKAWKESRVQALNDALACVPGGTICDPQKIADAITEIAMQ